MQRSRCQGRGGDSPGEKQSLSFPVSCSALWTACLIAKRLERAIQSSGCPTAEENSYTEVSGGSWCTNVYDSRTEGKEERGGGGVGAQINIGSDVGGI